MPTDNSGRAKSVTLDVAGRSLTLETGLLAEQAHGAVSVRYGDTVVLVTVVGEKEPNESFDFFPLSVDYEEKMYAAGKIPGGFIKREGRPTEAAILAARLTDRPLRPLFPKGYRAEVQIISTVMSADQENDPALLSIIGASAALSLSQIPWDGPIGAVRVGRIDGEIVVNPTLSHFEGSTLDMVVAGTEDAIMMVEGEAARDRRRDTGRGDRQGTRRDQADCRYRSENCVAIAGKEKWAFAPPVKNTALYDDLRQYIGDRLRSVINNPDKVVRLEGTDELKREILGQFSPVDERGEPKYSPKEIAVGIRIAPQGGGSRRHPRQRDAARWPASR